MKKETKLIALFFALILCTTTMGYFAGRTEEQRKQHEKQIIYVYPDDEDWVCTTKDGFYIELPEEYTQISTSFEFPDTLTAYIDNSTIVLQFK